MTSREHASTWPREHATLLRGFWYVVATSHEVKARPVERAVAGRRLVVFRDRDGKACVLDARCPHRGANLAHGTLVHGCIQCPYHGWRFDGQGTCVEVPSLAAKGRIPPRARARTYPAVEQQGLIWTTVGEAARVPDAPDRFPGLDERGLHAFAVSERIPVPFDWWVENILDMAHIPFAHRKTYGAKEPAMGPYAVKRHEDERGFTAETVLAQRHGALARIIHRTVRAYEMRVRVQHFMPGNTVFDTDIGQGKRLYIVCLATPEDHGHTRVWILTLRNYLVFPGADLAGKIFTRAVIAEDVRVARTAVHHISRLHPEQASVAADEPALEFVRLLRLWQEREEDTPMDRAVTAAAPDESLPPKGMRHG